MTRTLLLAALCAACAPAQTTLSAAAHCLHFSDTLEPTYYTVSTIPAVCNPGDLGSSANVYAAGLSVSATAFGVPYVPGGATAAGSSTQSGALLYPVDGIAHITLTISQQGVDDGGNNYESASFSVNNTLLAAIAGGFSTPPGAESQTWSFDIPVHANIPVPYQSTVSVTLSAFYGEVQASSSIDLNITFTPTDMLTFFLAGA